MPSKYVVGFDFGTTFSGIAYARRSHPDDISLVYSWPRGDMASQPYCKTTTSLCYVKSWAGNWECKDWGWEAHVKFCESIPAGASRARDPEAPRLVQKFKLLLADDQMENVKSDILPGKITADMAIADYFRGMVNFTLEELRKNFGNVQPKDIEWALTVPAIWSDRAKQRMRNIAKIAGMCTEGSEDVKIILEPEAAAAYCHHEEILRLKMGEKFLILDAGGGTVDIAVHEKAGDGSEVREVTRSEGGLFGATAIDAAFFMFLQSRITCLSSVVAKNPDVTMNLMKKWEDVKRSFRGDQAVKHFEVPRKVLDEWKIQAPGEAVTDIELTPDIMKCIMDPVINKILDLTEIQIEASSGCKALLLVGGFAESHYLFERVKERFSKDIQYILKPPAPGTAICQGAVLEVLHPNRVLSRVSRKTYGMKSTTVFCTGVHPNSKRHVTPSKEVYCVDIFDVFVRNGDMVSVNSVCTRMYTPLDRKQKVMIIEIFSTTSTDPKYVDETGVTLEGRFTVDIKDKSQSKDKQIEVRMWFGRSSIEVKAQRLNFGDGQETMPIKFAAE